jgi:hypothetical protein
VLERCSVCLCASVRVCIWQGMGEVYQLCRGMAGRGYGGWVSVVEASLRWCARARMYVCVS